MLHPITGLRYVRTCWSAAMIIMLAGATFSPLLVRGEDDAKPSPIAQRYAHAHNDYQHPRPLFDALDRGFCSVEADVFLQDGELLIGHERQELRAERTLDRLYLAPLGERARMRDGHIQDASSHFYLLIDIKSDGKSTYAAIHSRLAAYPHLFSSLENGVWTPRAITVVISGNVPSEMILQQTLRYAGIDGRPTDLQNSAPPHAMPWISANWKTLFRWRGAGPIPAAEKDKLRQYVQDAHAKGRLVRFWGTPENTVLWEEFRAQGVDLIGTDELQKLQEFCKVPE
ncbi:MAG: phosphatidylinositol-specific phospholipase C/glycerophosphodiester phosphodiesterase family protein [Planctomycetota bacterium]